MKTLARKVWTDAALEALPKERGKFELIDGKLTRMSPAGLTHGAIVICIGAALQQFVRPERLGLVFGSDAGFRLDPDNVLSPDVSYASAGWIRARTTNLEQFFPGVPELAVEVISPSERRTKIRQKMEKYFAQGTRIVWLVYPRRKAVEVFTSPDEMITLTSNELDGGEVLPGFRLPLDEIFAEWF